MSVPWLLKPAPEQCLGRGRCWNAGHCPCDEDMTGVGRLAGPRHGESVYWGGMALLVGAGPAFERDICLGAGGPGLSCQHLLCRGIWLGEPPDGWYKESLELLKHELAQESWGCRF